MDKQQWYVKSHVFGDYLHKDGRMRYGKKNIKYFNTEGEALNYCLTNKLSNVTMYIESNKDVK